MGTYFTCGATQADIVKEILDLLGDHLVNSKVVCENDEPILWTVEKGIKDHKLYQFIGCYLLREQNGDWGYKPMDETMGPCFYSVPLDWLKRYHCFVPDDARGYSREWRNKVVKNRLENFS